MSEQRYAVVLRGPTGAGKSTTSRILAKRWRESGGTTRLVSLDEGWGPPTNDQAEFRTCGTTPLDTYRDLVVPEELLLIELAWGEPGRSAAKLGATYSPREWLDILHAQERRVLLFRLSLSLEHQAARLRERDGRAPDQQQLAHWSRVEEDSEGINFPSRARQVEEPVDTNERNQDDVAADLFHRMLNTWMPTTRTRFPA